MNAYRPGRWWPTALIASAAPNIVFVLGTVLSIISGFVIMRWRFAGMALQP
jgi:hypothetical protein